MPSVMAQQRTRPRAVVGVWIARSLAVLALLLAAACASEVGESIGASSSEPQEQPVASSEPQEAPVASSEPQEAPWRASSERIGDGDPADPCVLAAGSLGQMPAPARTRHTATMELATAPTIEWTEFDPGIGEVSGLTAVGDGRVMASPTETTTESTGANSSTTITTTTGTRLVTTDGVHWDELALPEGIRPNIVDISGDSWLVTGRDREEPLDGVSFPLERVLISKDRGTTWAEVPVDSEPSAPQSFDQHLYVSSAQVSDGRIVLSSELYSQLDLGAVLRERGLISESQDAFLLRVLEDDRVTTVVVEGEDREVVEFTFEELSLTPDQRKLIERFPPLPDPSLWGVRIYSGDVTGLEATAEYEGYVGDGFATSGGFVLHVKRPGANWIILRHLLIASPDGRAWSERSLDLDGENVAGVRAAAPSVWPSGRRTRAGGTAGSRSSATTGRRSRM